MAGTHTKHEAIVPDEQPVDSTDSTFGDVVSSTTSIASSVLNYRRENGRTYHAYKDGKYVLPNDELESERLDLQHNLFILTFNNKLGLAPPNSPDTKIQNVLDVGTGTGIWAIDFADEHPEAKVTGVDLSPIQPSLVPPNLTFQIDDVEDEWTYSHPFDYIHSRFMTSCIADWTEFLTKCFDNLAPNGYIELQEADLKVKSDDGTLHPDNALLRCQELVQEASVKFGRAFQDILSLVDVMTKIGFVDIVVERFKWPSNTWPKDEKYKELGAWSYANISSGLEAITMAALTRVHGWSPDDVRLFLLDVRNALGDTSVHAYWPLYVIYARKPEA